MTKYPFYSLAALTVFVSGSILVLLFGNTRDPEVVLFLGMVMANIPGLIASFMAERNHTAIKNGIVQEKAKEGAKQAIAESQVMTRTGPVAEMELQALTELLERTKSAIQINTNAKQANTDKLGENNGPTL